MTVNRQSLGVEPPPRLLAFHAEEALSPRAKTALDQLEDLFIEEGFAKFTVRDLAARLRCSLRTLYEIAPSKRQLVLIVLDRFLHRVGRNAMSAIDPEASARDRIRMYYRGGADLQRWTVAFGADAIGEPELMRLLDRHFAYVGAMVEQLVAEGIASGELKAVNPKVPAAILSAAASRMTRADGGGVLHDPAALDELVDVVFFGIVGDDQS